jgi:hypothetical protein
MFQATKSADLLGNPGGPSLNSERRVLVEKIEV